jgi:hypothetical protein
MLYFLHGACAVTFLSLSAQLIYNFRLAAFVMVLQGEGWKQPELT